MLIININHFNIISHTHLSDLLKTDVISAWYKILITTYLHDCLCLNRSAICHTHTQGQRVCGIDFLTTGADATGGGPVQTESRCGCMIPSQIIYMQAHYLDCFSARRFSVIIYITNIAQMYHMLLIATDAHN